MAINKKKILPKPKLRVKANNKNKKTRQIDSNKKYQSNKSTLKESNNGKITTSKFRKTTRVSKYNKSKPLKSVPKEGNIVIIGNGPSVLEQEAGELIDTFTHVVRINDFKIQGYEKYLGNKTTIWSRSNSPRTKERNWNDFKYVVLFSAPWNYRNTGKILSNKVNGFLYPKQKSQELKKEVNTKGWPSTGLMTMHYFLNIYDCIYIYGFDFFKTPKHYYETRNVYCKKHQGDNEEKWVNKYVKEGRIKFLEIK